MFRLWTGNHRCNKGAYITRLNKNINIIQNKNKLKYKTQVTSMVVTPEQINLTLGLFVSPDPKPVV